MNSASPRTLTRSTTDRKISGVSGGLGAYLVFFHDERNALAFVLDLAR